MKHLIVLAAGAAVGYYVVTKALATIAAHVRDIDIDDAWEWCSEEWS